MSDGDLLAIIENIKRDDMRLLETLREMQNDTVLIDLLADIRRDDIRITEIIESLEKEFDDTEI